jgi:(p)ppGpp synthase/HD superfamily hydrolase
MKTYPLTDLEKKAWKFAQDAHDGVSRKFSGVPYFEHVRWVFKLLKKFDTREELGAAALLHDVVEDCDISIEEIRKEFGERVANLVSELTSNEEMKGLMGKQEYLLDKMYTMSDDALIIKLCDRLQNLSDHYRSNYKFLQKYYLETQYILDGLVKNRDLKSTHTRIIDLIRGMTTMMSRRYKLKRGYDKR